jgi:transcription initiation factor TFIID subunit TAF12
MMITLAAGTVTAQPKKSRVQQQQKTQTLQPQKQQQQQSNTNNQGMTQRMRLQYPTAVDMPENVVWRRDIYREIRLDEEANSGLYFPVEPVGKQMNLFTYIF